MKCKSCGKEINRLRIVYAIARYKKLSSDRKRLEDCYLQEYKKEKDGHQYQWCVIGPKRYTCPNPDCNHTLFDIKSPADAIRILKEASL